MKPQKRRKAGPVKPKPVGGAGSVTVWRLQLAGPGMASGPSHPSVGQGGGLRTFIAECSKNAAHEPPAANCRCGIYGVENVGALAVYTRGVELQLAYNLVEEPDSVFPWVRVVIVRGVLDDAVRAPRDADRHEVVRKYSDGRSYRILAPWGVHPQGFAIVGNPPGTWRGSRFTATGPMIMQAKPGDVIERVAKPGVQTPIEAHLVPEGSDGETRFSEVLRRYTDSGRTDPRWWADPVMPAPRNSAPA